MENRSEHSAEYEQAEQIQQRIEDGEQLQTSLQIEGVVVTSKDAGKFIEFTRRYFRDPLQEFGRRLSFRLT